MRDARKAILEDTFPIFVQTFMDEQFPDKNYPGWVRDALQRLEGGRGRGVGVGLSLAQGVNCISHPSSVGIDLLE